MTQKNSLKSLENKVLILLSDIKSLLKYSVLTPNIWHLDSKNHQIIKSIKKYLFWFDKKAIENKSSYRECKETFEKNSILKNATYLAGYWGAFDTILKTVINESAIVKRGKIFIDEDRARQKIGELTSPFAQKTVRIEICARLLGIRIKTKRIKFPNGLYLYRLNKNEINTRQPLLEPYHTNEFWADPQVAFHPTELRYSIEIPIRSSKKMAFFEASNEAHRKAKVAFDKLIESLLLVQKGDFQLGPISMEGSPTRGGLLMNRFKMIIPLKEVIISNKQAKLIVKAYKLLCGDRREKDKVLSQSLQRFFIGRQRHNSIDKLIDYVISWETILLTQKGSPMKQEMIYRFSVNGSSLLTHVLNNKDRKMLFKKMKCVYATRSIAVHGGSNTEIEKKLKSSDFLNTNDMCSFLEESFQKVVWWLINFDRIKRPYYEDNGWENLLWPN